MLAIAEMAQRSNPALSKPVIRKSLSRLPNYHGAADVLGSKPPSTVTINEFTTIASVWTNNQFLNGPALQSHALGLKIAAGIVPSFVDLLTGGWGTTIQDQLNSSQTPTMANFATLADVLAACVTRVQGDACGRFFAAAKGPKGNTPTDTLTAPERWRNPRW